MKRASAGDNEIYPCMPWFVWRQCCKCKSEFRRESGWRAFTGPFHGGCGVFRYICASCGPDRAAADSIIDAQPWIPSMPKVKPTAYPEPPRGR